MTPAERDEVRRLAQSIIDGAPSTDIEDLLARAVLPYVPAGDAADSTVVPFGAGDIYVLGHCVKPAGARSLAHALHAAADAAEET